MIRPDWPAPARVRGFVTTRAMGDMARPENRQKLPFQPLWLRQVHGAAVANLDEIRETVTADAAVTRTRGVVCAVQVADCMPVLFADEQASVVGIAHAGWRGLASGVLEKTIEAMAVRPQTLLAWMGPAIGPRMYEVGGDVYRGFAGHESAFAPTRPGHWNLDLYQVARAKMKARGIERITGGGFCTYSEPERFFSYRRDGATGRMAAFVWLAPE